jgi:hypothetical protein
MVRVIHSNLIGSLGNLSYYIRKDSDQLFVRQKGGAPKERIKVGAEFEMVRRNNAEFGGCAKMAKGIRSSFGDLTHVTDTYLVPALCTLAKRIQKEDLEGLLGQRRIVFTHYSRFLVGI